MMTYKEYLQFKTALEMARTYYYKEDVVSKHNVLVLASQFTDFGEKEPEPCQCFNCRKEKGEQ